MKQPNFLLKLATVVSSILLVGGFVCYRAGAFDWLMGASNNRPTIMGGSKSKIHFEPAGS